MSEQLIIVSSITYAYKAKDILERKGYRVYIKRASKNISACGCHFSLRVRGGSIDRALSILRSAGVRVIGTEEGDF